MIEFHYILCMILYFQSVPLMTVFQRFAQQVYSQSTQDSVRLWFKGPEFGQKMVDITKQLCDQSTKMLDTTEEKVHGSETSWDLLSLAFTVDDNLGWSQKQILTQTQYLLFFVDW